VMRNSDAARREDRMPSSDDAVTNVVVRTDGGVMMGSDGPEDRRKDMRGFHRQLEATSAEEIRRLHAAPSPGARDVAMPRWRCCGPSSSRCSPIASARPGC
jgi:hypothetical protein